MVEAIKKPELENVAKPDEEKIFVLIPESGNKVEKKDRKKKNQRESRLFKKHKKTIPIDKVKNNLEAKIYNNRFVMR